MDWSGDKGEEVTLCGLSHVNQELCLTNINMRWYLLHINLLTGQQRVVNGKKTLCEIRQCISGLLGLVRFADSIYTLLFGSDGLPKFWILTCHHNP